MGLLSSALTPVTGGGTFWPQDVTYQTPAAGFISTVDTRHSINVTADNAFGFPAFFAAVRVLSEDVAKLPLFVYEDLDPGKRRAKEHYLYPVLHDRPNPEMTSFVWREASMSHLVTWGNCYSEIVRNAQGETVELWPIRPDRLSVRRDMQGKKFYRVRLPGGIETVDLAYDEVFHIPGLGYDGLVGYSVINILSRTIELGMAAQEYGAQLWANNARPGGVLQVPADLQLSDLAKERLRTNFEGAHRGLSNAQRVALLEDGITWTETQIPPEDAQYIETRKFQVTEVARAMRLPPHKIGDLDKATFSNIEQQALEYVQDALGGWVARWEAQIRKDLLRPAERGRYFAEFNVDALLRADSLSRSQALWIQRQAGVINADEWRDIENRNPLPNGDGQVFIQPLNMTPVGTVPVGATPDEVRPAPPGETNPAAPTGKVWAPLAGIGVPQPQPVNGNGVKP